MESTEIEGSLPASHDLVRNLIDAPQQVCAIGELESAVIKEESTVVSKAPVKKMQTISAQGATAAQALQTVELTLGALGNFIVHVFSDGFHVHSKKYKSSLEISNVGQVDIFAREFSPVFSEAVTFITATSAGDVSRCAVSVVDGSGRVIWQR